MAESTPADLSSTASGTPTSWFNNNRRLRKTLESVGWIIVLGLIGLGLNSVIGRAFFLTDALATPVSDPAATFGPFDSRYYDHYLVAFAHLIPALLIVFTGPMQFIRHIRKNYSVLHRISGRIFLISGAIGAITGFIIGGLNPFLGLDGPGFNQAMATLAVTGYTLVCIVKAYLTVRKKQFGTHREWVIRSFSIMLGIATERLMLGTLMATTDVGAGELFGATFWMAGVVHILAAEFWIRLTRTPGTGMRHWKDLDSPH